MSLPAFRDQLSVPGSRFVRGTFTEQEIRTSALRPGDEAAHLAARFAAKEAFLKAWSGGRFGSAPFLTDIDLREIEVISDAWGRPALRLHGAVAEAIEVLDVRSLHVSMTHDGPFAMAQVILERPSRAMDY